MATLSLFTLANACTNDRGIAPSEDEILASFCPFEQLDFTEAAEFDATGTADVSLRPSTVGDYDFETLELTVVASDVSTGTFDLLESRVADLEALLPTDLADAFLAQDPVLPGCDSSGAHGQITVDWRLGADSGQLDGTFFTLDASGLAQLTTSDSSTHILFTNMDGVWTPMTAEISGEPWAFGLL